VARRHACAAVVAACAFAASSLGRARAAERVDVVPSPRLPAPLVLPELTHPRSDLALTWTTGRGVSDAAARSNAALALLRLQFEGNFLQRRLYAGITYDYASALPPDGGLLLDDTSAAPHAIGKRGAFGNVEPHVRVVFPLTEGLVYGFALGVVLPTATIDRNGPAKSAMLAAASMEPTDYVHFQPGRFALRPAGDLRIVRGLFVFQARQGFDIMIDEAGIESARTAGRLLAHVGVAPTRAVEISMEASQVYFFFTEEASPPPDPSLPPEQLAVIERRNAARERYRISDDRRTAFTVGPSVRLSFPDLDIGLGILTNVAAPLSPALDSFVAARLSLMAHFR
jgi:hypothetical protein